MSVSQIDIDAVSAGMVLAQELRDGGGAVLLPAGSVLTAANLNALRRRGVERIGVAIDDLQDPPDEEALAAARASQCARLVHLFRASAGVEASDALLAHLLDWRRGGPP